MSTKVRIIAVALVACLAVAWGATAQTTEDLAAVLPENCAAVVELHGLAQAWDDLNASRFVAALKETALWKTAVKEGKGLAELEMASEQFQAATGISLEAVLKGLVGEELVIGVAMVDGEPAFVAAARVAQGVDAFSLIDTLSGMGGETPAQCSNVILHRGVEIEAFEQAQDPSGQEGEASAGSGGKKAFYRFLNGTTLVFTNNLDQAKGAVDRLVSDGGRGMAGLARYASAVAELEHTCAATLYVDIEQAVAIGQAKATAAGATDDMHAKARIMEELGAFKTLIAGLWWDEKAVHVEAVVNADRAKLSSQLLRLRSAAPSRLSLLDQLPDGNVILVAGKMDLEGFVEFVLSLPTPEKAAIARAKIQKVGTVLGVGRGIDVVADILGNVGPEAAVAVRFDPVKASAENPGLSLCGAVQLKTSDELLDVLRDVGDRLIALVQLSADEQQEAGDTVNVPRAGFEEFQGGEIGYVVPDLPEQRWLEPSFCVLDNLLLLGTSKEWIKSMATGSAQKGLVRSAEEQITGTVGSIGEVNGVLFVDCAGAVAAAEANRTRIIQTNVAKGKSTENAEADISAGISLLRLVKAFIVTTRQSPEHTRLAASLYLN